jgi:outer membrane protein assembly factor BamD
MKKAWLLIIGCWLLAGCSGNKITPDRPLVDIYTGAYDQLKRENFKTAANEFMEAEKTFPSSEWAADALIMSAYASYLNDDFAGALITTDRFMRFHPGHKDVAYVLYLRGMSYYRQVSDVRRDPGMSVYALNTFQSLVQRFPNSPYTKNAENKIIILKNYIAGKMMYSARRDMKRNNYPAAIETLQSVVVGAQETKMTAEAMFRLTEAYTAIGMPDQAKGYAEMLRLNFPDNEWTKKLK